MGDKIEIITLGKFIQNARNDKNLTVSDLAFNFSQLNYKYYEKKINAWENDKDFPDLNEIYKLAQILEVDTTLLLTLRDRTRKNIYGVEKKKPKRSYAWLENFFDDFFHVFLPAIIGFYVVALVFGFNAPFIGQIQMFIDFLFSGLKNI